MRPSRPGRPREDPFNWLSLLVTEGPFLSRPALKAQFPSGMPRPDGAVDGVRKAFRAGFTEWERAWTEWVRAGDRWESTSLGRYLDVRDAWVRSMVADVLGWGEHFDTNDAVQVTAFNLDHSVTVTSTGVLSVADEPSALVLVVEPTEDLAAPGADGWTATALDRAAALLRASGEESTARVPVAVVTDGRWWALAWQSEQGAAGSGVFDGALFREEPDLRDAFWALARLTSLAGGSSDRRLSALLKASVVSAEEITDALGSQVRASVELLVQSFSTSHLRAMADGLRSPLPADGHEVYDAAVTSMMRVVFLLFAEANELLPTEQLYRDAYAISDVLDRLDERRRHAVGVEGDEALAATYDTWHRLLAASRALFDGATFEDLRMPAYGGSLFDPSRLPWLTVVDQVTGGLAVLVDDRVMYHVLRSVQHAVVDGEDRQVSFRELDVEQIGYVYEGLLGYSARYTEEVVVGLQGPEAGGEPEVPLEVLHELTDEAGEDPDEFAAQLVAWLKKDQPGAKARTARQLAKAYAANADVAVEDEARRRLRPVVGDGDLVEELAGYYTLMRQDPRSLPLVVPAGGLVVVETRSRATSGTHYTPRSLAEEVVHHALEPLVYSPGPLQTADTTQWVSVSSSELLDLKVADIAVGSGAFLVAAARYLGDRLLEAWDREGITRSDTTAEQRRRREVEARREVIAQCLYGADINPMAVEMCKLSLWLVSLDPDRPFSFVDDKIFCGNSLLGLTELRQLEGLHIDPSPARLRNPGFTADVHEAIKRATEIRHQLASPVSDVDAMRSTRAKRRLMQQLDEHLTQLRTIADGVVAAGLRLGGKPGRDFDKAYENLAFALMKAELGAPQMLREIIDSGLTPTVQTDYSRWRPLHWVLEAPEVVVDRGGFDAVLGNPPFLGGKKVSLAIGQNFRTWLVNQVAAGVAGNADIVAYFFLRAFSLLTGSCGSLGLIATNTIAQGDTREVALDQMQRRGLRIGRAIQSQPWPARSAQLRYAAVWGTTGCADVTAPAVADGQACRRISTLLEPEGAASGLPLRLQENRGLAFVGSNVNGAGFVISKRDAEGMLRANPKNAQVIRNYIRSDEVNGSHDHSPEKRIIDFGDMSLEQARGYAEPFHHVSKFVRPHRASIHSKPRVRDYWWRFESRGFNLYSAISALDRAICIVQTSKTQVPVFMPARGVVYTHKLVVMATADAADLATLSSALHVAWILQRGSSMKADPVYTPTDVFQTFPRPARTEELRALGEMLSTQRRDIMLRRELGLTSLYNLVNGPEVGKDVDVGALREMHVALDKAVVRAYGWDDVSLGHGFHTYRQVERFTISPTARIELLDRLLKENHRRAAARGGDVGVPVLASEELEFSEGGDA